MKGIIASIFVGFIASMAFSGCASYNASPLHTLSSEDWGKNRDIVVTAKTFDRVDCKKYLDRDVIEQGYQPIQLYIQNNTDKNYFFSLNRISFSCARPEEVADKVHTSTVGRAAGYGAAALIIWPFAVPAIVDGIKSAHANEALDNDFSFKTAHDQTIPAHSHFNKLIFVPLEEYHAKFTVELLEQETNTTRKLSVFSS